MPIICKAKLIPSTGRKKKKKTGAMSVKSKIANCIIVKLTLVKLALGLGKWLSG